MTLPKKRGTCMDCGFRWGLKKDGTVRQHWVWSGMDGRICEGSGYPPEPTPLQTAIEMARTGNV